MDNYVIAILKDNIKRRMNELSITQSKLSEETGIPQPTISNVLSKKNGSNFTVIQLIEIAQYLECSIDDLVGLNTQKKQKIETLSDILKMLFEIDSNIEIKIVECTVEYYEDGFPLDVCERKGVAMYLDHPGMENILNQWNELKRCNIEETTKNKVMELWKEDILEKYRNHKKERKFYNESGYIRYLANMALTIPGPFYNFSDLPQELRNQEDVKILCEYIDNLPDDSFGTPYTSREIEELRGFRRSIDFCFIPTEALDN